MLVVGDILFAPINGFGPFVHPEFPVSILASISAGIGEEIMFRGFLLGLWVANIIAALAFGAGHLGTLFYLTGASSFADLNPIILVEVFLLNGIVGLVAGERYMKDGLVAASGVHFWTDIVFHVLWGLM